MICLLLAVSGMSVMASPATDRVIDWQKFSAKEKQSDVEGVIRHSAQKERKSLEEIQIQGEWAEMFSDAEALYSAPAKAQGDNIGTSVMKEFATIETKSWGRVYSLETGKPLFFTQENELSFTYGDTRQPYYKGVKIGILNEKMEEEKSFSLKLHDTTMTVSVLGTFSTSFFNTDPKREFLIHAHSFARLAQGPAYARDTLYVVNEDGEVLQRYGNTASAILRMVGNAQHLIVFRPTYTGVTDSLTVDVFNPRNQTVRFHFAKHRSVLSYTYSANFAFQMIDGNPYYVAVFYEKPFVDAASDPRNPVVSKNNHLVAQIYDAARFELKKEAKFEIFGQENHEWSMGSLRYFSDYMISQFRFNSDSSYEFVYSVDRLIDECDCISSDLYLVGEDGKIIKTIKEGTGGVRQLQEIPGQPSEFVIFEGTDDAITGFSMTEAPSLEMQHFGAMQDGEMLSLTFERMPDPEYGKKYIFALRSGTYYEDTASLTFGYFSPEGKLLKKFYAKVGEATLSYGVILNSETLNPYLFNSDDALEVVILGMEEDAAHPDTYLHYVAIASETNGTILHKIYSHPRYGAMSGAGLIPDKDNNRAAAFYVVYSNGNETWSNPASTVFYEVPFVSPTLQGKGTEAEPYVITSPVELDYVRKNLDAWYVLGNNIDMRGWLGLDQKGFEPIGTATEAFTGHLDGKGYWINNLYMRSDADNVGLFAMLNGAEIKNINFENADVTCTKPSYTTNVGILAGSIGNEALVENVHIQGTVAASGTVNALGGMVGSARASHIRQNSFSGDVKAAESNSATAQNAGGIVGSMASTIMEFCYAQGRVEGMANAAGGLAGTANQVSEIYNAYSLMEISGNRNVGGMVGSLVGRMERTWAGAKVNAARNVSGLVGNLGNNPAGGAYGIYRNVAMQDSVSSANQATNAWRVASWNNGDSVGSNYALSTMKIGKKGEEAEVAADNENAVANGKHGAGKAKAELTEDFYKTVLGWSFGSSSDEPWHMDGELPHLWFEYVVRGVVIAGNIHRLDIGQEIVLEAHVVPATAINKTLYWETSDRTVARVDQNGKVTGISKGTATITVSTDEGDFSASCLVKVEQPVEKLTLDVHRLSIAVNGVATLAATIEPEDADNKELLWRSSDPSIVMVSSTGMVRGMMLGEADVIVFNSDRTVSDTCHVAVVVPVAGIILDQEELSMKGGDTVRLSATVRPSGATNKKVVWSSSDPEVATVDAMGLVKALKQGTALITAASDENPDLAAYCDVTVTSDNVGNEDRQSDKIKAWVSNDMLYVQSGRNIERVCVVDMAGRVLIRKTTGSKYVEIPVARLNKGVYIVRVDYTNAISSECKIYR